MRCGTLVMIGYAAGYAAKFACDSDHWLVWIAIIAVLVWALHQARDIDRR